jgi:acetyl esterase/lipase
MIATVLFATLLSQAVTQPQVPMQTYVYKTDGQCAIRADVYRAAGDEIRPAILWIHGGALIFGHRGTINRVQLSRYMEAGFVVVAIDYRLAPETKLPAILEDLEDAYRWLRSRGPGLFRIDPDRIAVVGHSAGGYLTLTAGYRLHPRPKALVAFYGYGDIVGDWYSSPDPFYLKEPKVTREQALAGIGAHPISEALDFNARWPFYLYCRQQGLWPKEVVGTDPAEGLPKFNPYCPVRNVTKDYPPTMLLHGDKDTDVPYQQSVDMARELERAAVIHEFVPIPGGGHGFDREMTDPRTVSAFNKVVAFLARSTQPPSR